MDFIAELEKSKKPKKETLGEWGKRQVFQGLAGDVASFGSGFAKSATIGLTDLIPGSKGGREKLKELNPWAYTAGNVAGYVPSLLSRGATKLGVKGIQKIAEKAPVEVLNRLGLKAGQKIAGKTGGKLIGGAAGLGTNIGIQSSVYGGVEAAQDFDPSNPMESAQHILTEAARSGRTGVLTGGALSPAGKGAKALAKGAFIGLPRAAKGYFMENSLGLRKASNKVIEQTAKYLDPVIKTMERTIGKIPEPKIKTDISLLGKSWAKTGKEMPMIKTLSEFWSKHKNNARARMDGFNMFLSREFPSAKNTQQLLVQLNTKIQDISSKLNKVVAAVKETVGPDNFISSGKMTQFLDDAYKDIGLVQLKGKNSEYKKIATELEELFEKSGRVAISPVEMKNRLTQYKSFLSPYESLGDTKSPGYNFLKKFLRRADEHVNDKIEMAWGAIPDKQFPVSYKDLLKEYGLFTRSKNVIDGNIPGVGLGPFQYLWAARMASGGSNLAGLPLALGGAGAAKGHYKFKESALGLSRYLGKMEGYRGSNQSKLNPLNIISEFAASGKGAALPKMTADYIGNLVPGLNLKQGEKEELSPLDEIEKKKKEIEQRIPDEAKAGTNVEVMLAKERVANVINRLTPKEFLLAKAEGEKPDVAEWRGREFVENVSTALIPENILGKMAQGSITHQNVQDFKEANPYLYSRLALDLWNDFKDGSFVPTYNQKLALGVFLERDLTGLKGGVFNVLQESVEPMQKIYDEVKDKAEYVKGNIRKQNTHEQVTPSQRYASL